MLKEALLEEIKSAMKAKDKPRLSILRQVNGELKNIEVNERRDVSEADVDAMIKRVLKQTKETLEASIAAANDEERTALLSSQVEILESLLPEQLAGEALDHLIGEVVAELGATTKKDMGKVMGAINARTGGNFDKASAAKKLQSILS
ncbi:MAG: GatB/YqeY domain-containing protein [Coriobacteriales bacterium]|nr:GatB/YqeY domain-containing protein [Coriobacteriales bacterium]